MDEVLGDAAATVGIKKSCLQRAAPPAAASSSSTSANTTETPAEQPQPGKAPKRRRDQPPVWFQSFVEEHRQWRENFCEERRQEFAVLERQNNERLRIMQEFLAIVRPATKTNP